MRILDRYIIRSFLINYLLALSVLMGIYILFDLIVNFDNFTKAANAATDTTGTTAWAILSDIVDFYAYQSLAVFQQIAGIVPLLAAGFTMVRMTRHNELTAMLASGVSLYRVATPIIICAVCISAVHVINQELIIPQPSVVEKLMRKHGEVAQPITHNDPVYFVRDTDNSLVLATRYDSVNKTLYDLRIIQRDENGAPLGRIMADVAIWEIPPKELTGGVQESTEAWVMKNARQIDDRLDADPSQRAAGPQKTLLYHTGITPAQLDLVFSKKSVEYLSSAKIYDLIQNSPDVNKPMLARMMHIRFTQPLMNLILLLIGIPFLLTREPGRLIINMFYCVAVAGFVFASTFMLFQLGGTVLLGHFTVDPLLAAWLPVLIFGPLAAVMLDTIRT